jgi:hypothetical protein
MFGPASDALSPKRLHQHFIKALLHRITQHRQADLHAVVTDGGLCRIGAE